MLQNILCRAVSSVGTTGHSRHKISSELTNQDRLDVQNSLGMQVGYTEQPGHVQIKGLCMGPEEHKSEISFGPDELTDSFLSAVLWFAL